MESGASPQLEINPRLRVEKERSYFVEFEDDFDYKALLPETTTYDYDTQFFHGFSGVNLYVLLNLPLEQRWTAILTDKQVSEFRDMDNVKNVQQCGYFFAQANPNTRYFLILPCHAILYMIFTGIMHLGEFPE
jgi:hypothetical protein